MFKIKIFTLTLLLTYIISGCASTPENETKRKVKDIDRVTISFRNGSEISTIDKKIISVDGSKVIFDLSEFSDAFIEGGS
jgi:lipoprotein